MLTRACPVLRRGVKTEAISRIHLDINAHHHADQAGSAASEAVKKSPAAVRGQSLRGDVELPRELQDAVTQAIEDGDDKPGLRLVALELYAHLRRTSAILPAPASHRDRAALTTTYDGPTALAYAAGLMPSVFGATVHALTAARDRLRLSSAGWTPDRVVDYGSGTGSAAWAVARVWGPTASDGRAREYVGLDGSRSMVELSSSLFAALPQTLGDDARLVARAHQLPIPSSSSALAKLHISPAAALPGTGRRTLALCAFTLGDQGTKEKRKELVRAMWESNAEVLVLVERGTPGGSRMVIEAREQLLMYGKRNERQDELAEGVVGPARGSFVVAPCPHDGPCPLHHSTKSYCHFSQRVRSPPFLRYTKHATTGEDDAKFSYVVIQRGTRPVPSTSAPLLTEALVDTLAVAVLEPASLESANLLHPSETPGDELQWPRVVAPPLKRSGHIILEVCTASGELERHTIPKSQGKQAYYDARKAAWGDAFPHAPKNGAQAAPAAASVEAVADKFGRDRSKLRSKKATRGDRGEEQQPGGRGERRRAREGKDREGEVRDIELEMGPDGQFRAVG